MASTFLQHAVALCKSHIASLLDINVPVLGIAKQFAWPAHSKAAEEAAYHFIDARLDWIQAIFVFLVMSSYFKQKMSMRKASERPDWRPHADHIKHAKDVIAV